MLAFAGAYTVISTDQISIINLARKCSLFNNEESWIKRETGLFHVSVGVVNNGAEVC